MAHLICLWCFSIYRFECLHQLFKCFRDSTLNVGQENCKYHTQTDFKHRLPMRMKPCFEWQAEGFNIFHAIRKVLSLIIAV
jgi:hypothetical protein